MALKDMVTKEKVLSVTTNHLVTAFDLGGTTQFNSSRPDLILSLDRENRVVVVRHADAKFKGKSVLIPFETVVSICIVREQA